MPTITAGAKSNRDSKAVTVRPTAAAHARRHSVRYERDSTHQRWLYFGAAGLAVLAVVILAAGWYVDTQVRSSDTAAVVFGEPITTGQVAAEMQSATALIDAQARQMAEAGGQRAAIAAQVDQQKRALPDQALNQLVEQRIIAQEAARRGIGVTPEEIEAKVQENVAQYHALTEPQPTPEAQAEPAAAPAVAADASASPTAVPSLEPAQFQAAFQKQLDEFGLSEARYREIVRRDLLREKVQAAIAADVPAAQEQVHARHILLPDEGMAQEALSRLQGGADFAQVARELSTDPGSSEKGGDLGWFPKGVMNEPFQNAAFGLQPGQRSEIVRSPNGFHIIEVLERDPSRPVEEGMLELLKSQAFSKWLAEQRTSPEVTLEFVPAERDWTLRQIGVRP